MKQEKLDSPLFQIWMREHKHIADSTIYVYKIAVEAFLKTNPDLSNLEDYNNYLIKTTIRKRAAYNFSAIKAFIEFKYQGNLTARNKIIDGLIKPPIRHDLKRERKNLSKQKILDVVNLLTKKHRLIALTQYITGLRASDVLGVKRGSIVLEEYEGEEILKIVALGKGKKRNVVYVHDKTLKNLILDYITKYHNHDDYYFLEAGAMRGRPGNMENEYALKKSNYLRYWKDLKYALNVNGIDKEDFATHDFRRCFARKVWEKEKDVYVLQSLLNHTDPKVTLRYLDQSGLKNIDYHKKMQS